MTVEIINKGGFKVVHFNNRVGKERWTLLEECQEFSTRGQKIFLLLRKPLIEHLFILTGGIMLTPILTGSVAENAACEGSDLDIDIPMPKISDLTYEQVYAALLIMSNEIESPNRGATYLGVDHRPFTLDIQGIPSE